MLKTFVFLTHDLMKLQVRKMLGGFYIFNIYLNI